MASGFRKRGHVDAAWIGVAEMERIWGQGPYPPDGYRPLDGRQHASEAEIEDLQRRSREADTEGWPMPRQQAPIRRHWWEKTLEEFQQGRPPSERSIRAIADPVGRVIEKVKLKFFTKYGRSPQTITVPPKPGEVATKEARRGWRLGAEPIPEPLAQVQSYGGTAVGPCAEPMCSEMAQYLCFPSGQLGQSDNRCEGHARAFARRYHCAMPALR